MFKIVGNETLITPPQTNLRLVVNPRGFIPTFLDVVESNGEGAARRIEATVRS